MDRRWLWLLVWLILLLPARPCVAQNEVQVLVMSSGYKKDWALSKDRDSVAANFNYILEPDSFDQALQEIAKVGRGGRIRRLVFLGHGYRNDQGKGGIISFGNDVNADVLRTARLKAYARGDSSVLDAFAQDAEIIYFNCHTGLDPDFLKESANLYLAFSGGTVYGSDDAVSSDLSAGNRVLYLLSWLPFVDVNFKSPSKVDYHKFKSATLPPFLWRNTERAAPPVVRGPNSVALNARFTVEAILPPEYARPGLAAHIRCWWFEELAKGRRSARLGQQPQLTVEAFQAGTRTFVLEVRLDNNLGARLLGSVAHQVEVGDDKSRAEAQHRWLQGAAQYIDELLRLDEEAIRLLERRCADNHARQIMIRDGDKYASLTKEGAANTLQDAVLEEQKKRRCMDRPNEEHLQHQAALKATRGALDQSRLGEGAFQEYVGLKDYKGYLAAVEAFKSRCKIPIPNPIPQPAPLPWTYSLACSSDEGGQTDPVRVQVRAQKPSLRPGETVVVTAEARGGSPPYTYRWSGDAAAQGPSFNFTSAKSGSQQVTVTVTDRADKSGTASLSLEVGDVIAQLLVSGPKTVPVGASLPLEGRVLLAGRVDSGFYLLRWQPTPQIRFEPQDSTQATARATFPSAGPVQVWLQVLDPQSRRTVAESAAVTIEVGNPKVEEAARKLSQARDKVQSGQFAQAAQLGAEAGQLDPPGTAAGRAELGNSLVARGWKAALSDDYAGARTALTAALTLNPQDSAAAVRLSRVNKAESVWPQLQRLGTECDQLLSQRRLLSAYPVLGKVVELGNSLIYERMDQHPYVAALNQRFHASNAIFNQVWSKAESQVAPLLNQHKYAQVMEQIHIVEEWELGPANTPRVAGWRSLAQQGLNGQKQALQDCRTAQSALATGRLQSAQAQQHVTVLRSGLQWFASDDAGFNTLSQTIAALQAVTTVQIKPPPPPPGNRIGGGTTSSESAYQPNCQGDVFNGGYWCNAKNGSDWIQRTFDATYQVSEIRIGQAGTDVTTEGSSIELQLLTPEARWLRLDRLENTNINWEQLSGGGRAHSIPAYSKVLSKPLAARAFRLVISGHGWFAARDIVLCGNPVKTSIPTAGNTEVLAVLVNQSKQNVHIFAQGDNFGPHNRLAPGEKRELRLRLPADGRIRFSCGRDGQVLGSVLWNGDPDDPNRYPKVIFSAQQQLLVTTGLR